MDHRARTPGWIEPLEPRMHLTAAAAAEGDWTAGYAGRITGPSGSTGRYAFAVTADARLAVSVGGPATSVRLEDVAGDVAFAGRRSVAGVIPAGAYTLVVTDAGPAGYTLAARAVPTRAAATLFPAAGTRAVAGYTVTAAAPATDLADGLGTFDGPAAGRFAGTVVVDQHYTCELVTPPPSYNDRLTVALRSPELGALQMAAGDVLDGTLTGTGGVLRHQVFADSTGTALSLTVTNVGDPGVPVPFRLVIVTSPVAPPPVRYTGGGGGYSVSAGGTTVTAPSDPTQHPIEPDAAALLSGDANGWKLEFGTAPADRWTFAADGTGVRAVGTAGEAVAVGFGWAVAAGRLTVTFANGTVESATAETVTATGDLAWFDLDAANGTPVGKLYPA